MAWRERLTQWWRQAWRAWRRYAERPLGGPPVATINIQRSTRVHIEQDGQVLYDGPEDRMPSEWSPRLRRARRELAAMLRQLRRNTKGTPR